MWSLLLEFFFVRAVTRLLGVRGCSLLLLFTTVAVAIFGAIMHAASDRRMQTYRDAPKGSPVDRERRHEGLNDLTSGSLYQPSYVMLPRTLIEFRLPEGIPDPEGEQQRRYQLA